MTRWMVMALVLLAGCVRPQPVDLNDGYAHWAAGGTFECDGRPVAVDGSHRNVVLEAGCKRVRVTGSFDDVIVYVDPDGTVEITGIHDTVVYRLVRRGTAPRLINTGTSNELLRNSTASWEQDHDWYQELH